MKILLIEDDKNLCEMLRFQLESEHHEVEVCMDGRDGLDLFGVEARLRSGSRDLHRDNRFTPDG